MYTTKKKSDETDDIISPEMKNKYSNSLKICYYIVRTLLIQNDISTRDKVYLFSNHGLEIHSLKKSTLTDLNINIKETKWKLKSTIHIMCLGLG